MSSGKEWPCGAQSGGNTPGGGGNAAPPVEEWSVHAQLTFTPQAGNIVLTTHDGSSQQNQHRCTADSGYSSERVMSPRSCASGNLGTVGAPLGGARATCSVTVAGHHTVTLTCAELPFDGSPIAAPPPPPPPPTFVQHVPTSAQSHQIHQHQQQHVCQHQHDISKPPIGPPPGYQPQFHHHPPPPAHHISIQPTQRVQTPPVPPTHIPAYRDAASQTSTTQVPQVVQSHLNKPKSRQLVRSPARVRTRSPATANKSTASSSDSKKQPRTVHIDVYCTGSESTSSSSSEEETTSTPQTVFESSRARVVHTRANSDSLPHALMKQKRRVLSNSTLDGSNLVGGVGGGASSSTISTSYPSPRSSLVSHRSLASASTLSSLRTNTTNHSSTATSWKDTDLESTRSLLQCDSFEYDNSFDKLRIEEKEKQWLNTTTKQPKSIRGNDDNEGDDDDDDDEDSSSSSSDDSEEGLAWSFAPKEDAAKQGNIRRENTVRRTSNTTDNLAKLPPAIKKSGSLSDSEASSSLRYKRDAISSRKMPYSPPSIFEHNMKAARFGPTVGSLRRPGHHVGPSKNPDCSCDTCKYYFEHVCYRNRTRSLGDRPMES